MFMGLSALLFAIFFFNVFLGATGGSSFLDGVPELVLLAASTLFFVAAILKREAAEKKSKTNQ